MKKILTIEKLETLKKLRSKLLKNGNLIVEVPNAQDFLLSFELNLDHL